MSCIATTPMGRIMRTFRGGVIGCFMSEYCCFHLFKPIIEVVQKHLLTSVHDDSLCRELVTTAPNKFSTIKLVLDDNSQGSLEFYWSIDVWLVIFSSVNIWKPLIYSLLAFLVFTRTPFQHLKTEEETRKVHVHANTCTPPNCKGSSFLKEKEERNLCWDKYLNILLGIVFWSTSTSLDMSFSLIIYLKLALWCTWQMKIYFLNSHYVPNLMSGDSCFNHCLVSGS